MRLIAEDRKLNYYALCLTLVADKEPEQAWDLMGIDCSSRKRKYSRQEKFSDSEIRAILELRQRYHTWQQIAEPYNMKASTIQRRVRRYLDKKRVSGKEG